MRDRATYVVSQDGEPTGWLDWPRLRFRLKIDPFWWLFSPRLATTAGSERVGEEAKKPSRGILGVALHQRLQNFARGRDASLCLARTAACAKNLLVRFG